MIILAIAILLFSCKTEEESTAQPPLSTKPNIEIVKVEPLTINQFESIIFEISFIDGNGDIGTEDADDHPLEITDNRKAVVNTFHIPPQSPGEGLSVKGVFVVELENVILLDQSNDTESTTFDIRLRDREGNWSAVKTSPTITINK